MARREGDKPMLEEAVEEAGTTPGPACVRYTGDGRYIMGVPTADIHDAPAEQVAALVESGLYVLIPDCSHGG